MMRRSLGPLANNALVIVRTGDLKMLLCEYYAGPGDSDVPVLLVWFICSSDICHTEINRRW